MAFTLLCVNGPKGFSKVVLIVPCLFNLKPHFKIVGAVRSYIRLGHRAVNINSDSVDNSLLLKGITLNDFGSFQ